MSLGTFFEISLVELKEFSFLKMSLGGPLIIFIFKMFLRVFRESYFLKCP